MIPYSFHPEARAEYAAAALYYASRRPGLGDSFADAVEQALSLIREYPELGSPIEGSARRVLVRRFPYAIIYREEAESLHIVAIADLRREPGYWRHRE
jgi:plasmid stabilization system protein ParE